MTSTVFEVEQAGCESCAARVRGALVPIVAVAQIEIDEDRDTAAVRLAPGTDTTEEDVNRALLEASHGSGHTYRVKPGSWRLER